MKVCFRCHQPITNGSTMSFDKRNGAYHDGTEVHYGAPYTSHLGCPTKIQIMANLFIAMEQGFEPEFCRTHYLHHK